MSTKLCTISMRMKDPTQDTGERAAWWPEQADQLMEGMAAGLRSKSTTFTFVNVMMEFTAPVFKKEVSQTLDRSGLRMAAVNFLHHRLGRKDSTHLGEHTAAIAAMGDRALANALIESSTHKGVSKKIVIKAMAGWKGVGARFEAAQQASGNTYTVVGDTDNRTFAGRKKATALACRLYFPAEWGAANDANCKDMRKEVRSLAIAAGHVLLNGVAIQPTTKTTTTTPAAPAPVASQSSVSVSAKKAKDMAAVMGATGKDVKTKAAAVAYLASKGITL